MRVLQAYSATQPSGQADKIRIEVGAGTMTCEWALFGVPGL